MTKALALQDAIEPEVVPPESSAPVPVRAVVDVLAQQVRDDFEAYAGHERNAALLALRIGMTLLRVQELLPHGQFVKWMHVNLPDTRRSHAYRFKALAKAVLEEKQIAPARQVLLADPAMREQKPRLYKGAEQLLLDFIGGRSQAEMFAEYGIAVRDPKKRGGARPHPQLTDDQKIQRARENLAAEWHQCMVMLHAGMEMETWRKLSATDKTTLLSLCERMAKLLHKDLRGG